MELNSGNFLFRHVKFRIDIQNWFNLTVSEFNIMGERSKAFMINGGAGRVLCSIPALEKYYEETGDENFIIVCEGGTELYKGHPVLDPRTYDIWHKNLFHEKIKDRDIITLEPYRIWEYYNQKASLSQAFDIEINGKGIRELQKPKLILSNAETGQGIELAEEIRKKLKKEKIAVIQPFGRNVQLIGGIPSDATGRSFDFNNTISLIKKLQKEGFAVVLFSDIGIDTCQLELKEDIAQPKNITLRQWASLLKQCNLFLGCDSVGQHLCNALDIPAVAVFGSTYPINVSYPETDTFRVVDLGENSRRYSPIRITQDEYIDRCNERLMYMTDEIEDYVLGECKKATAK